MNDLQRLCYAIASSRLTFIPFEDIVKDVVCDVFDVTNKQLLSKSRKQPVIFARYTAYYILRKKDKKKYTQKMIGSIFEKDHASVIHGCREVDSLTDVVFGRPDFIDNFKQVNERVEEYNKIIK